MRPTARVAGLLVLAVAASAASLLAEDARAEARSADAAAGQEVVHILTRSRIETGLVSGFGHERRQGEAGTVACDYREQQDFRCRSKPPEPCSPRTFAPPYPTLDRELADCPELVESLTWVAPSAARDGARVLAAYREMERTRKPVCEQGRCEAIFATNTVEVSGRQMSALALCTVAAVGDTFGAPQDCRLAVLDDAGRDKLQVVAELRKQQMWMGRPDYTIVVYTAGDLDSGELLGSVSDALAGDPLELLADRRRVGSSRSETIVAVSEGTRSRLLRNWVWATVRVDREPPREVGQLSFGDQTYRRHSNLEVSVTLMVNELNTSGRPVDWHFPTRRQFSSYLDTVKLGVALALESNCVEAEWIDSQRLLCSPATRNNG